MLNRSKTATVLAAGFIVASLTGCSSATTNAFCEPRLSEGALIQNIAVLGGFGTEPIVSIPEGFTIGGAQSKIIDRAEDRSTIANTPAVVTVNYALFESQNGEMFEQSASFVEGKGFDFMPYNGTFEANTFGKALDCAAPGDRILMTFPEEEAASIAGSLGLEVGTNIAALIDVHEVAAMDSTGGVAVLPSGFPGVVFDNNGNPGIVVAPGKAPQEIKVAAVSEGSGRTVTSVDNIVANYLSVTWDGRLDESTWLSTGPKFIGSAIEPGHEMRLALDGQKVGSKVVSIIPDAQGSATIHVVEILAAG